MPSDRHVPERPPSELVAHMSDEAPDEFDSDWDGPELERRVCPDCRLYFDAGEDTDDVYCSGACRSRHRTQ